MFIPCGRLSWLPDSFLLHVKYILSYQFFSHVSSNGHEPLTAVSYVSPEGVMDAESDKIVNLKSVFSKANLKFSSLNSVTMTVG